LVRALWFFLQLSVVAAAAIWLSTQQGEIDVAWRDYTLSMQLGVFLLGLAITVFFLVALFNIAKWIATIPTRYRTYRGTKARERGYQALTRGFVAIAAGDAKKATQYAKEVRYLIPHENGLPLLLEAQAARLRGEEEVARHSFEELLKDKDAAFFGIRGLLKSSLDAGDTVAALEYARTALAQNPKQPWIIQSVYDLEIRNHQWRGAYETLPKMRKFKVSDESKITSDEVALLLLLADEDEVKGRGDDALKKVRNAVNLNPAFVPAVTHLCDLYWARDKKGKITGLVERAWKENPHTDLAVWWDKVSPQNKADDNHRRLRWHERLITMRPEKIEGYISAAMVAMEDALWAEAREHLDNAEKIEPRAQIYRLRAKLEEASTFDPRRSKEWLEKAADAAPDPVWYCGQTGVVYKDWSPIALPHGAFNTIIWGLPIVNAGYNARPIGMQDTLMIEGA
jgi:HemY protein